MTTPEHERPDVLTEAEAKAAVTFLSQCDGRVTITEELSSLAEVWHYGLRKFTGEQVRWGIKHYYGVLAVDGAPALTAAQCRKILLSTRRHSEAKQQARLEPPEHGGDPMPEELRQKLDAIGRRT